MTDLKPTPKFKYITQLCYLRREIFSIYIPTRARTVNENNQDV